MLGKILIQAGFDASQFNALKARAFAFTSLAPRAADVLRQGQSPLPGGVFSAYWAEELVGSVSLWPVRLVGQGPAQQLTLLGPLMVAPEAQGYGVGAALMEKAIDWAQANAIGPIMLIGDEAYYGRFGFSNRRTQGWRLPGLSAPERVLLRACERSGVPQHADVLPAFAPPADKQAAA